MDLTIEPYDSIMQKIDDKRREVAEETPPNEVQGWMAEGVIMGLDIAGKIVTAVLRGEDGTEETGSA